MGANAASQAAGTTSGQALTDARHLINTANVHKDIQTHFGHTPPPDPHAVEFWNKVARAIGKFFAAVGELFAPIWGIMPWLPYVLGAAVVGIILWFGVRLFMNSRFERLRARDTLKADAPWRPTRAAVTALLGDIDALAAQGLYDEAVHLLLVRSVADINAFRPDLVRLHYSARDILSHPLLPEGARPAFRAIVGWVETSYFAGVAVGKAGFDACRQAYVAFVAAEGIA